jgi:hypothetical protein
MSQRYFQLVFHAQISTYGATKAEFLEEIQAKVLRVFLLAIHSHLFSFALRFLLIQTHTTSYSF